MKLKLFRNVLMLSLFTAGVSVTTVALADDFAPEEYASNASTEMNAKAAPWFRWQYAGQVPGPIHGAPNAWNPRINYCGTEYPQGCGPWQRGQRCYVNNGYWWDNARGHNWFNSFVCR